MSHSFFTRQQSTLKKRPLVIGTIAGTADLKTQIKNARHTPVDMIEVRLDTLPLRAFHEIRRISKPLLLTIRSAKENGKKAGNGYSDAERLKLFETLLPFCDAVDVELRHPALLRKVTRLAHRHGVGVIHSYHDFKRAGRPREWVLLQKRSAALKGDVFKIAVMPKTPAEVESFLRWGLSLKKPAALIAMGPLGEMSRYVGYSFGSVLTYGHFGRSAAPGQPSAAALVKAVRGIYR
jgi:3-dehydroquinate dehydratase-1